jgi:Mn-dependent DtxR family transcriptional regulator
VSVEINDAAYWREFERNGITHSAAHYLMAIDTLRQEYGYARVTDVADMLEVSRGAASMSLSHLKKRGWVTEDHNRFLLLTDAGRQIAELVEHNFKILATFFEDVLGVRKEVALADACKMEHLMSLETGQRLLWLMRWIMSDESRMAKVNETMRSLDNTACASIAECPVCKDTGACLSKMEPVDFQAPGD